ncbi:hypothetical protein Tco_1566471 [Tanacetum coccineum]
MDSSTHIILTKSIVSKRHYIGSNKLQGRGTMNSPTSWRAEIPFRNSDPPIPRGIFINQAKYAQEILKKHGMTLCDSVGTLMATKPLDVDLNGTLDTDFNITAFSDSDHAGYLDTRKGTSGGIQFLAQVLWLRTQLTNYGFHFDKIHMYCDSKASIAISCNPVQHSRTKHIDVRYHFIKEQVEKGIVELFFVETEYQLADLFTKALPEDRFKYLVRRLDMRCLTPEELEVLANEYA